MIPENHNNPDHNDNQPEDTNQPETPNKQFVHDDKLEALKEYHKQETNGAIIDPSARRNISANGYTQRTGQKDELENLHIGGDETGPQGGNDHQTPGENAAGPGFETEGSYEMGNAVRSREQEFGADEPSGPARPAHD